MSLQSRDGERAKTRLVNLVGIGAPRTATTSLARMLKQSGQVFVPDIKEVNGFGIRPALDSAYYEQHYSEVGDDYAFLADISPVYLSHEAVPGRIRSYNSSARIIATLRDPVERVLSQYAYMRATVDWSLSPDLELGIDDYLEKGLREQRAGEVAPNFWYSAALNIEHSRYGRHLQRYLDTFPREQVLMLIYEDLRHSDDHRQPGSWATSLRDFLGIDVDQRVWENRVETPELRVSDALLDDLRQLLHPEVEHTQHLLARNLRDIWR